VKRWLAFLLAWAVLAAIHEGTHALTAAWYGVFESFGVTPFGFEVRFLTPVHERSGVHWGVIAGASNLVTVAMGYLLLFLGRGWAHLRGSFATASVFYLTLLALLADPLNLSIGPFLYGGDANGIAAGFCVDRYVVQGVALVLLLTNRELIAGRLFPLYGVEVRHPLFRPLVRWGSQPQARDR